MSSLRYDVRVAAPERHTVDIELRFSPDADTVDITLPAWCPGSYLIRDYARFVRDLEVHAGDDTPREVTKIDKQTWRIEAAGAKELVVSYTIYRRFFTEGQTGYGSAMSVVVLFVLALLFILASMLTRRRGAGA